MGRSVEKVIERSTGAMNGAKKLAERLEDEGRSEDSEAVMRLIGIHFQAVRHLTRHLSADRKDT